LEYRFFPFEDRVRGFFIGPLLQLQGGISGVAAESDPNGSGWCLAALGASLGYQLELRPIFITIVSGYSVALFHNQSIDLGVYLLEIPKTVEVFIGFPL